MLSESSKCFTSVKGHLCLRKAFIFIAQKLGVLSYIYRKNKSLVNIIAGHSFSSVALWK
jgi:hypothetical protein